MLYVLSQILFCLNVVFFVTSQMQKKKSLYMLFYIGADVLFAMHYLCLEKFSAVIFVLNEAALIIILYLVQRFGNNKYSFIPALLVIIADVIACVFTWTEPLALLPLFATSLVCIGMCISNVVIVKSLAVLAVLLNTIYIFAIHSYLAACVEVVLWITGIIGLIISIIDADKHKKLEKYKQQNITP